MDIQDMTKPAVGEKFVWQHSGEALTAPKVLTDSQRARRRIFYKILGFLNVLYLAYGISRPEGIEFILSSQGLTLMFGLILFFLLLPKFDEPIFAKFGRKLNTDGVPLWMSRDRIMFNPTYPHEAFEVRLRDIKAVKRDFVAGSPAIVLQLANKTVNLISSDANKLLKRLYILRPELEPTS